MMKSTRCFGAAATRAADRVEAPLHIADQRVRPFRHAGGRRDLAHRREHARQRAALDDDERDPQRREPAVEAVADLVHDDEIRPKPGDQLGVGLEKAADLGQLRDLRRKPAVGRDADHAIAEAEREQASR